MGEIKSKIFNLKENSKFSELIKKLILDKPINSFQDKSYILACAITLLKYVDDENNRNHEYNKLEVELKTQYSNQKNNDTLQLALQSTSDKIEKVKLREKFKSDKKILENKIKNLSIAKFSTDEYKVCIELAYYIILKYSLIHKDYKPLYDFSVNFGYYPIARIIFRHNALHDNNSLHDILSDIHIDNFEKNDKVLIYQQKKYTDELLESASTYKSYIAPTSYGKSEFILDLIKKENHKRIVIISPTKLLVRQNGNVVKEGLKSASNSENKYKIIYHHDMYDVEKNKDTKIIASFTQERALRFLKEFPNAFFDFIIIDEAHELFKNDGRSHLIEIFKQKNKKRNPNQKIIFLSPTVNDGNSFINTSLNEEPNIFSKRVKYSIKEPELFFYENTQGYKYNRYLDLMYETRTFANELDYINKNALNNNLIFLTSPRDVQEFSQILVNTIDGADEKECLLKIAKELAREVHKDFYMVDCIRNGIVYLHGKLPDDIRDYIVSKFKNNPNFKYLVANSVVLSGVNFPIDNLFILKLTQNQSKNDLINLIGRINRLNYIFSEDIITLKRLLTPVHFLSTNEYDKNERYKLVKQIKKLCYISFEDNIKNDLLKIEPIKGKKEEKNYKDEIERYKRNQEKKSVIVNSEFVQKPFDTFEYDDIRQLLYIYDLQDLYQNVDAQINIIYSSIKRSTKITMDLPIEEKVMELIYRVFFEPFDDFEYKKIYKNYELGRLRQEKARKYYWGFMKAQHNLLSKRIDSQFDYYIIQKNSNKYEEYMVYVGHELGEDSYESNVYKTEEKVYINIKKKEEVEIANLAILKIQIEDEYVAFHLHKFFGFLFDVGLLNIDEYNSLIYGSTDKSFIDLVKQGLPISIVNKLTEDNMLQNIEVTDYAIVGNKKYIDYHSEEQKKSDFFAFTLDQYIDKE